MNRFTAYAHYLPDDGTPRRFEAILRVATLSEAKEIAATFPKSLRVSAGEMLDVFAEEGKRRTGYVHFTVRFGDEGIQGTANEAGLKRLRGFLAKAGQIGWDRDHYSNGYATLQEFLLAVGFDMPAQSIKP